MRLKMRNIICSAMAVLLTLTSALSAMCRECQFAGPAQNCATTHEQALAKAKVTQTAAHSDCEHSATTKKTLRSNWAPPKSCETRTCEREQRPAIQMNDFRGAPFALVLASIAFNNVAGHCDLVGETPACTSIERSPVRSAYDPLAVNLRI